mmetsp:Transcript_10097/g.11021  ORF Transcript_10097/g.11021 Transcript_10097/m.11021 type:complete len:88 (+) Transcript_10097:1015-1278(+)
MQNKATSLSNLKRFNEAIKWIDRAIEIEPANAQILVNKGTLLLNSGQFPKAFACFCQVLELDPKNFDLFPSELKNTMSPFLLANQLT